MVIEIIFFPNERSKSDENVLATNDERLGNTLRSRCTSDSSDAPFASLPHQKRTERLMTSSMISRASIKSAENLDNSTDNSCEDLVEPRSRNSFLFGRSLFQRSSRKSTWVIICIFLIIKEWHPLHRDIIS